MLLEILAAADPCETRPKLGAGGVALLVNQITLGTNPSFSGQDI